MASPYVTEKNTLVEKDSERVNDPDSNSIDKKERLDSNGKGSRTDTESIAKPVLVIPWK